MIIIERFLDHSRRTPLGCMGELHIDGQFFCYTIEQPWRENRRFVSCVPVGEYALIPFESTKYGKTFALSNAELNVVPTHAEANDGERYACLFHSANWSHQLQGCIAPGKDIAWGKHGANDENIMVTDSRRTLDKLMPELKDNRVIIRWKHG